jgi:hypothetical protein
MVVVKVVAVRLHHDHYPIASHRRLPEGQGRSGEKCSNR